MWAIVVVRVACICETAIHNGNVCCHGCLLMLCLPQAHDTTHFSSTGWSVSCVDTECVVAVQRAAKLASTMTGQATEFVLVRHGETDWNKERRLQGQSVPGPPLNALGCTQAELVCDWTQCAEPWLVYMLQSACCEILSATQACLNLTYFAVHLKAKARPTAAVHCVLNS